MWWSMCPLRHIRGIWAGGTDPGDRSAPFEELSSLSFWPSSLDSVCLSWVPFSSATPHRRHCGALTHAPFKNFSPLNRMTDSVVGPSSHFCHFLPISMLGTGFPPGQHSHPYPCNWTTPLVHVGGLYMINMLALPLWYLPSPTCLPSPRGCSLQGQLSLAPHHVWMRWRKSSRMRHLREDDDARSQDRVSVWRQLCPGQLQLPVGGDMGTFGA